MRQTQSKQQKVKGLGLCVCVPIRPTEQRKFFDHQRKVHVTPSRI